MIHINAYAAAREGRAWRDCSHFGRFVLRGKDAPALLHHLTTNNLKALRPNRALEGALLSSKARLIDWISVARVLGAEGDEWRVVTSPNRRAEFEPHARRFVLFRQEVSIKDVSDSSRLFALLGPQAQSQHEPGVVQVLPGAAQWPTRRLPRGVWSWHDAPDAPAPSGVEVDGVTFNILRVEAGLPVAGAELTDAHNPWEANLDPDISLAKGCYNGQEVVARLHSYAKIKQRLRGLKLPEGSNAEDFRNAALQRNNREVGRISSAVVSPTLGPIALAYVREDAFEPGGTVQVLAHDGEAAATMLALPFE